MTLIEALVAVSVLTIATISTLSAISYMRMENRTASQRMLVASLGTEMIELFKSLQYADMHNSTASAPVYLKGFGSATPNLSWVVPKAGQWQALPVETVNSGSGSTPGIVADKIPQGVWTVDFVPDPIVPELQQINIRIQWKLYAGSTRPPLNYAISTEGMQRFSQPVMSQTTDQLTEERLVLSRRISRRGFTLMEASVAGAIGSIIGLISIGAIAEGTHLFKTNSTEMIARDQGSRAVRRISSEIQQSLTSQIFSNYLGMSGAGGEFGSCLVLQKPSGTLVAYYRYAPTSDPNSGGIYYAANAATTPNPLTDKLLVSSVRDLEFRRDVNGSIRVGFNVGTFASATLVTGGKEADLVRFSTSTLPRN